MVESSNFDYDIFLSYRHKPLDNRICKKTHTLLETYKPPRRYKSAKIRRVFRDDDELPVAGILSDTISNALNSTRVLLVICTPDTPESQWVDREVRTFIELGRSDKIFALLVKGTPQESFPKSLLKVQGIENRTLNVASKNEKQILRIIKRQMVKVVAEATDTPYDSLRISNRRRAMGRAVFTGTILTLSLIVGGLYSLFKWTQASYYNIFAQREEIMITDVIKSLTFDLPSAVSDIPGSKPIIAEVLNENLSYLNRMIALDNSNPDALMDMANNYLALAHEWLRMADSDKAFQYVNEALEIYDHKVFRQPTTEQMTKEAGSFSLAGLILQEAGYFEEAFAIHQEALKLFKSLYSKEKTPENKKKLAEAYISLGNSSLSLMEPLQAKISFDEGLVLYEELMSDDKSLSKFELSKVYQNIGSSYQTLGDYEEAGAYMEESIKLLEDVGLTDAASRFDLARSYIMMGLYDSQTSDLEGAVKSFNEGIAILTEMPFDMNNAFLLSEAYSSLGLAYQNQWLLEEAESSFIKCLDIREKVADVNAGLSSQTSLAQIYQLLGNHYKLMERYPDALTFYSKAITILKWLVDEKQEFATNSDLGACLNDKGTVYLAMGDRDNAVKSFLLAIDCFTKLDEALPSNINKTNLVISCTNTALCFNNQALYEEALPYYLEATEICDAMGKSTVSENDQRLMADTYNAASSCLLNLYDFKQAMVYSKKCLDLYEALAKDESNPDYQRGYGISLYFIAINQLGLDQRTEAEKIYKQSLNILDTYVNNGDESFRSTYYNVYALYYLFFRQNELEKAKEVAQMALDADPNNTSARQTYSYCLLFTGDYDRAFKELSSLMSIDATLLKTVSFDFCLFDKSGLPKDLMDSIIRDLEQLDV